MINPFFEAKKLERKEKLKKYKLNVAIREGENGVIRISGRQNLYTVLKKFPHFIVKIQYQGKKRWITYGDNFSSFKDAIAFIHECLAYELVYNNLTGV